MTVLMAPIALIAFIASGSEHVFHAIYGIGVLLSFIRVTLTVWTLLKRRTDNLDVAPE